MSAFGNLSATAAEHKARGAKAADKVRKRLESAYEYLDAQNCGAAYVDILEATFSLGALYSEAKMGGTSNEYDEELMRILDVLGPAHIDAETEFRSACVAKGKGYQMPRSAYLNGIRSRRRRK